MNAFDMSENVQFNFLTVYLKKKNLWRPLSSDK